MTSRPPLALLAGAAILTTAAGAYAAGAGAGQHEPAQATRTGWRRPWTPRGARPDAGPRACGFPRTRGSRCTVTRAPRSRTVIERPRAVHFGANEGDRPLVILLATLFRTGSPASIPVPEGTRAP